MSTVLPISAVVPTRDRANVLKRTLASLADQGALPAQLIIIDASHDDHSRLVVEEWESNIGKQADVFYERATHIGAASQRNQGIAAATQPFIWFFDDDILFETDCVARLWEAIKSDNALGGVNAMITNQQYKAPGRLTRLLYRALNGSHRGTYAGMCIGPALNVLPEDNPDFPAVVPVEWLNTTCTMYRRTALPVPTFDSHFTGYSLMEDLALSLVVGQKWKLANVRTARIFHDSQPADYKMNQSEMARMELVNRHFIMSTILGRTSGIDYAKLLLLEIFGVVTPLASPVAWRSLPAVLSGKVGAVRAIAGLSGKRRQVSMNVENGKQAVSN